MTSRIITKIGPAGALQFFQLLRYGALLAIGIFLAKSGMDRNIIGQYETLMLLSGLVSFFWVGALFNALVPMYSSAASSNDTVTENSAKSAVLLHKRTLVFQTFLVSLLISIIVFALLIGLGKPISSVLSPDQPLSYYHLFCWYILLNNPSYLAEYLLLLERKTRRLMFYGAGVFSLQLIGIFYVLMRGGGLEGIVWILIGFACLKLLASFILLTQYGTAKLDRGLLKKQLRLATPLAGSLLLGGASAYIDGLIISMRMDRTAFAIFQYGAREFPLVLLLANAFSTASSANVAGNLRNGLTHIKKGSARLMNLLFPLSILLMLSSKWLYPYVFSPDFSQSYPIFNIYLLLIVSRLLFPQTVLTGMQKTRIQLMSASFEFVLNLSLSLILLPHYGMMGVAFATVIAHLADKILLSCFLVRTGKQGLSIAFNTYTPVFRWLVYCIILAACYSWTVWG